MLSKLITIMKKQNIIQKLQSIGLSEKEAEVYLTLVEIWPSTVLEISRNCSVKRATIYWLLQGLESLWIIRLDSSSDKHRFIWEPPKQLEYILERQKKDLDVLLPDLEKIYMGETNPNAIRFYRGKQAMYKAYSELLDSLKPSDDYLVFWDLQTWHDTDPEFFHSWPKQRVKIIRSGRSIFTNSPMAEEYRTNQWKLETTVKILNSQKQFHAIKLITSDRVFLHKTWKPYLVIVIENQEVVKLYKEMFEVLWEML